MSEYKMKNPSFWLDRMNKERDKEIKQLEEELEYVNQIMQKAYHSFFASRDDGIPGQPKGE